MVAVSASLLALGPAKAACNIGMLPYPRSDLAWKTELEMKILALAW
jgi:hypothetical protein